MKTKTFLLASAVALTIACSGCSLFWFGTGAAIGAGAAAVGVSYAKGDLEGYAERGPIEVAKATEKAFEKLQILKVSSASTAVDAEIVGRTAGGDNVKVKATASGTGSNLSIRIGTFGDEIMSRRIYDEIQKQLPLVEMEKK